MSFDCDDCGKNSVNRPGDICSECQTIMLYQDLQAESEWYSRSRLCQSCKNAEGPDWGDKCSEYKMPLYMVARKYKCKHYNEYIDNGMF